MDIRPPESLAEFRAAMRVNRAGWRATYRGIVADEVFDEFSIPDDDELREDHEEAVADGVFLVAVDDGEASVDDGEESVVDGEESAAVDDGEVVGFADVYREATKPFVPEGCVELRAIYVDPDQWREGVGSRLLAAVVDAVDADSLFLETLAENGRARSFYRERGFNVVADNTFEVDGDTYPTTVYVRAL